MYLDNKYTKWYNNIVEAARNRPIPTEYTEKHHIIPKSLGGSNETFNIVSLTGREHILCHWLLTKMVTGQNKYKMIHAFRFIASGNGTYTNRKIITPIAKISTRKKHKASKETKQKMSLVRKGKTFTDEHKKNMSIAAIGKMPTHSVHIIADGIYYSSIAEASRITNLTLSCIKWRIQSPSSKFKDWYKVY